MEANYLNPSLLVSGVCLESAFLSSTRVKCACSRLARSGNNNCTVHMIFVGEGRKKERPAVAISDVSSNRPGTGWGRAGRRQGPKVAPPMNDDGSTPRRQVGRTSCGDPAAAAAADDTHDVTDRLGVAAVVLFCLRFMV